MKNLKAITTASDRQGERLVCLFATANFLIFFQAYMIAPLIPRLAEVFHVPAQTIGIAVVVYMIPYGVATLFYGVLSDRVGRRPIILISLAVFALLAAAARR